ncbi:hypothetical protein XCR1_1550004 [Xenorhabdus cabanillasii JM26]|uniref:Uncharacterized protein n=1 Tax=Xenorhabdus cabanillasii JM26 TaxID=1427517 RepID=W1IPZ3_9GAMM|nr:hypothetical protein XCR1_1550004 [Xenorhabdus cabanillasii JM26]
MSTQVNLHQPVLYSLSYKLSSVDCILKSSGYSFKVNHTIDIFITISVIFITGYS